jgi:hypothetical protein
MPMTLASLVVGCDPNLAVHCAQRNPTILDELSATLTLDCFPLARHPPAGGRENSKSGLSIFGLLDYRGWPRRRLHSPRAERMKVRPPSPPSAQSVQTKKKPPADLAISP